MREPPPASQDARSPRSRSSHGEISLKRKALGLAILLILVSSILNALFGDRGLIEMLKAKRELETLEQEITAIRAENEKLFEEIRALKTSPLAIERLAREQLGLVKPGEVVLIIRQPPQEK